MAALKKAKYFNKHCVNDRDSQDTPQFDEVSFAASRQLKIDLLVERLHRLEMFVGQRGFRGGED